jgi:HEPN domain-containing protein
MKERVDLIRGWLRKANSDMAALEALIQAGSFDAACFHAQQAAEKSLKALLIHFGVDVPRTHNLSKLVELAARKDPSLRDLIPDVEPLTPYAVETRYDDDFWPTRDVAEEARCLAKQVEHEVRDRLPPLDGILVDGLQ